MAEISRTITGILNPGWRATWSDGDWNDYSSAAGLQNNNNEIGKHTDWRAVSVTWASGAFNGIPTNKITKIYFNVTISYGDPGSGTAYRIGKKTTATALDWQSSGTIGYITGASNKLNTTAIPTNGIALGPYSSTFNSYIRITAASLVVYWTQDTYTVNYDANGGNSSTVPSPQIKTENQPLTLSSQKPTRNNGVVGYTVTYNSHGGGTFSNGSATKTTVYNFDSWNTQPNGSGTRYGSGATYSANAQATLYAQWSSSLNTTTVTLPTPTRTGYVFNGWYTAETGGTRVTSPYRPTASITLHAQWSVATYVVSYNKGANGTGTNTTDTKTHDVSLTLKGAIFTRTGYDQTGWSTTDGGSKTYNLSASYTANAAVTLYPYWTLKTYPVQYNKNTTDTVSNMPSSQTKTYGTALTLSSNIPTRTDYLFQGWATSSSGSVAYNAGASYTANAAATLYAVWKLSTAALSSVTSSVNIGSSGTANWTVRDSSCTYTLKVTMGNAPTVTVTAAANASNVSFTIPTTWYPYFPNNTSATATATLYTYTDSGSRLLGTSSKTFTVAVPTSVIPAISSYTVTPSTTNSVVSGWGVFVQGYTKARISLTCSAGTGASGITSITLTGQGVSKTFTDGATTVTFEGSIQASYGSFGYKARIVDARGRAVEQTITVYVNEYSKPSVSKMEAVRCLQDGTVSESTGTYAKERQTFSYSAVNKNASGSSITAKNSLDVKKVEYKAHTGSTWSTAIADAVSGNNWSAVFGNGALDIALSYDIRLTLQDKLGSTNNTIVLPPVTGFHLGFENDRARFGGVSEKAGLQVDWNAEFNGVVDVTQRRCYASLSSQGWYKVCTLNFGSNASVIGATGFAIDICATTAFNNNPNDTHFVSLLAAYERYCFVDEKSVSRSVCIDKIRYVNEGNGSGHIDIHYSQSVSNLVTVDFAPHILTDYQQYIVAEHLQSVAASPSGETVLTEYTFAANTEYTRYIWTPTFSGTANPSVNATLCFYSVKNGVLYAGGRFNLASFTSGGTTVSFTLPVSLGSADRSAETIGTMFTTTKTLHLRWDGSNVYITDAGGNFSGGLLNTGYWSFQIVAPIYN